VLAADSLWLLSDVLRHFELCPHCGKRISTCPETAFHVSMNLPEALIINQELDQSLDIWCFPLELAVLMICRSNVWVEE